MDYRDEAEQALRGWKRRLDIIAPRSVGDRVFDFAVMALLATVPLTVVALMLCVVALAVRGTLWLMGVW